MIIIRSLCIIGLLYAAEIFAANYPFPHRSIYPYGVKPDTMSQSEMNQVCLNWFDSWKNKYVVNTGCAAGEWRVQRIVTGDNNTHDCVSEGIGYGMIIMVYMCNSQDNTKAYFDGFWKYYKSHPSGSAMAWRIDKDGNIIGDGAASDADLDAAFALLMADKQWGSNGQINYLQEAKNLIGYILNTEVTSDNNLRPGNAGPGWWDFGNPSYLSPAYYQIFRKVTGENRWNDVLSNCYNGIVSHYYNSQDTWNSSQNMYTGLQPNWCSYGGGYQSPDGDLSDGDWSMDPHSYWWDACRFPFRQGYDYLLHGTAGSVLAKNNTERLSKFFKAITNNNPEKIKSHYSLNGQETPWGGPNNPHLYAEDIMNLAGFVGSTAIAAMVEGDKDWLNKCYQRLVEMPLSNTGVNWGTDYFCDILKMLYLLVLTGNMPDFTTDFEVEPVVSIKTPYSSDRVKWQMKTTQNSAASGQIQIKVNGSKTSECILGLYDANGRMVARLFSGIIRSQKTITWNRSDIADGLYFLRLYNEKGSLANSLVVK